MTNLPSERHPSEQYLELLAAGRGTDMASGFTGEPLVHDPQNGEVRGHAAFLSFVTEYQDWLSQRAASVETVAVTRNQARTVTESLLHLEQDGRRIVLPVAVVGEDASSVSGPPPKVSALRVYHSMWPLEGGHRLRPPILPPDPSIRLSDVVAGYQRALAAGDLEGILAQFEDDGYFREPAGGDYVYRGRDGLRTLMNGIFSNGGGIPLEHCTATDDGVRCAIEFNAVSWGVTKMPPQAGVAVYERKPGGRLAAARIYDDVTPPI